MKQPEHARRSFKNTVSVVLFLFGLSAVTAPLYLVGRQYYYAQERARINAVNDNSAYLETAVWGNSHGECINLNKMGQRGENLSARAQDLFEIDYKVRSLLPSLKHLNTALISMSYFSFLYDNAVSLEHRESRDAIRIEMYASYPVVLPYIRGDAGNFLFGILSPLATRDHWRKVMTESPVNPIDNGRVFNSRPRRRPIEKIRAEIRKIPKDPNKAQTLSVHARRRTAGYGPLVKKMSAVHPSLEQDSFDSIERTIRRLHKQGVRVVLFTPPYYQRYNDLFNKQWKASMMRSVKRLAEKTGTEYFNFSKDAEFENVPELFMNSDHLNDLGGTLFSAKLGERVFGKAKKRRKSKRQ